MIKNQYSKPYTTFPKLFNNNAYYLGIYKPNWQLLVQMHFLELPKDFIHSVIIQRKLPQFNNMFLNFSPSYICMIQIMQKPVFNRFLII